MEKIIITRTVSKKGIVEVNIETSQVKVKHLTSLSDGEIRQVSNHIVGGDDFGYAMSNHGIFAPSHSIIRFGNHSKNFEWSIGLDLINDPIEDVAAKLSHRIVTVKEWISTFEAKVETAVILLV